MRSLRSRHALATVAGLARRLEGQVRATLLGSASNVRLGRGVVVHGAPIIEIHHSAKLVVGDLVTLNSSNRKYHINMYSPVKLVADHEYAEIQIGDETRIHGSCLHAFDRIVVGKRCLIAANCQIADAAGHPLCLDQPWRRVREVDAPRPVLIEDDVWLCAGVMIFGGVTIGAGTVVAANSVVTRDLPSGVLAGGVPARVLKTRGGSNG